MELIAEQVTKAYGGQQALDGVSLRLQPGLTAVLGPNGSGKSTLLRLLATAMKPDAGTITFAGRDYALDPRPLRQVIGYVPQHLDLPGHMTVRALLRYVARLKDMPGEPQTSTLLRALGLSDVIDRRLATLSGGQRRLVGIAQGLLGQPRLLLLDEALVGLDVEGRAGVLRLLQDPATSRLVVLSSHVPADVEGFAGHVIVLRSGTVVASGSSEELRRLATGQVWEVRTEAAAVDGLLADCLVSRLTVEHRQARLRVVGSLPLGLAGQPVEPSLEEAYLLLRHQDRVADGQRRG